MGKSFQMDSHVSVIACLPGDEHMFSPKIPITRNLWQLFSFRSVLSLNILNAMSWIFTPVCSIRQRNDLIILQPPYRMRRNSGFNPTLCTLFLGALLRGI